MTRRARWLWPAVLAAIAAVDLHELATRGAEATLSRWVAELADGRPIVPFALGVLTGHLLWPQDRRPDSPGEDRGPTPPAS
jgi:hypothetical protein